ncbi:DUF2786 domain-containing protein [Sphingomonas hankookensis]|uniref:DUF2786 domain-containing protein n=1 Tax=Sphingomonas hankookensis TaxID=563996 RepID=UPI003D301C7F
MTQSADRDALARRIRALRAKTVENGCTEEEAASAAGMLATLLAKYNMTLDEAEVRASPFTHHREQHDDFVGERLWKVADGIEHATDVRYATSPPGVWPVQINFFGLAHEVEVARYMLEICANAMRREQARVAGPFLRSPRARRRVMPFLDGMADRLRERIRAMRPPQPPGTGLVVLRNSLVDQGMKDAGFETKKRQARGSRDLEQGYRAGRDAGDRVALNRGLRGGCSFTKLVT